MKTRSRHQAHEARPAAAIPNRQSAIENHRFFKQVYAIVRTIPRGKVLTYGQIATMLGSPYMARQVGWAMHGCPKGLPWQRVIGAGGRILVNSLSIGEGALLQRRLLELEGVRFAGQKIDMAQHQFLPVSLKLKIRQSLRKRHLKSASRTARRSQIRNSRPGHRTDGHPARHTRP